jgi:hypothetical protein
MFSYSAAWLKGSTPYIGANLYPPLASVLFCPLAALPFPVAYLLVTLASIVAFVSVTLVLPLLACRKSDRTALIALTMAGLLSYGFQFEIERGQFNVLAVACCAWALFLFHAGTGPWFRSAAYLLFTLAIQLKVYPAIFIFAFARNARDWQGNLARWAALGLVNIALLFVMGKTVFRDFLGAIMAQSHDPFIWFGNHSLKSFVVLQHPGTGTFSSALGIGCGLLLAASFVCILLLVYMRNERSSFKYLVAICGLSALLIPAVSHDYKLPVLAMTFALYVGETGPLSVSRRDGIIRALLCFVLSLLYAWTLFSYALKPVGLQNNAPVLLAICGVLVLLMLTEEPQRRESLQAGETSGS